MHKVSECRAKHEYGTDARFSGPLKKQNTVTAFFLFLLLQRGTFHRKNQQSQFSVTKNAFLSFFINFMFSFFIIFRHARMHFLIPHSPIHMPHNFNRNNVGTRCGYHIIYLRCVQNEINVLMRTRIRFLSHTFEQVYIQ